MAVRIAAIVIVSEERHCTGNTPVPAHRRNPTDHNPSGFVHQAVDILGENLLSRALHRLEKISNIPPIVLAEGSKDDAWFLPRSGQTSAYTTDWDKAVAQQVELGAEVLLLVKLNAYTDLDYQQLLDFHRQTSNPLTRVRASDALLDLALVNVSGFGRDCAGYRNALNSPVAGQCQFVYHGYLNRLRHPQDYYKLIEDSLCGRCALKPRGIEVEAGVWYGAGTEVDRSAMIVAPAFIGADSHIAACATVSGASVERNCQIDCGTAVTNSWVLENTYVGVALEVRRSLVGHQRLFHLDREVELAIPDARLIGVHSKTIPLLTGLESFFGGMPEQGA